MISDLILGGTAAGIILYLFAKYGKKETKSHTIPPIIIKPGGELEIECDQDLDESSLRLTNSKITKPTVLSKVYKRRGFGPVKGIEIQYYDSEINKTPFRMSYYNLSPGVRVEIWLQKMLNSSPTWGWVDQSTPQIIIRGYGADFEVEVDNQLSAKEVKKHPTRKVKRKYKGNPNTDYRMGRISIYSATQSTPFKSYESDPADDHDFGDQYALAFHNRS